MPRMLPQDLGQSKEHLGLLGKRHAKVAFVLHEARGGRGIFRWNWCRHSSYNLIKNMQGGDGGGQSVFGICQYLLYPFPSRLSLRLDTEGVGSG